MNYHSYFGTQAEPVECCIVGTGGFGRSFLAQSLKTPLISTRVAVDLKAETAADVLRGLGIDAARIAVCATADETKAAWEKGFFIAAGDIAIVLGLPVSVVVEATGHPEAGARHCRLAIDAGKHVALVSKEVDSVVGPGLSLRARQNNVIVTPVDGDQPSLLMGLITWAEVLGLDIVAAGKASEYDFVFDPENETLTSNGKTAAVPGFGDLIEPTTAAVTEIAARRGAIAESFAQRAVPDLCEMTLVANASGFTVDRAALHAPIARITEVADFFSPRASGGLLDTPRSLDVFHCLRLPGEVSFAGGVFVTVRCDDAETWAMLAEKGHVVSRKGDVAMLYIPRHLLGVEAATSILEVGLRGVSSGATEPKPVIDLVAHADADIAAGTVLTASGHHHSIVDVSARMVPAAKLGDDVPVPFYLAANRKLKRAVRAGRPILCGDVELDEASELLSLRRQQDKAFF
ncbi:NAD(P)H-dependent oxidoreductase [Rhizobium metallidurans]|uniref:Putative homoserine dehydrogenase-like protein n=1 Tax=Rhizobium metallidurans TaxID=1265931 RepID=A0A7W6CYC0_9HYPH|nr:flagellar biosynthesis protein FlgA [Rhizobium metallidurans]MBB3967338.1 putative homoserine dehydrogenase-like protein [Rhizobium metallidurans]